MFKNPLQSTRGLCFSILQGNKIQNKGRKKGLFVFKRKKGKTKTDITVLGEYRFGVEREKMGLKETKDRITTEERPNEDTERLLDEMTQALQECMEVQDRYSEKLDELVAENQFLTDTIIQSKLGKITVERRHLIEENRMLKRKIYLLVEVIAKLR